MIYGLGDTGWTHSSSHTAWSKVLFHTHMCVVELEAGVSLHSLWTPLTLETEIVIRIFFAPNVFFSWIYYSPVTQQHICKCHVCWHFLWLASYRTFGLSCDCSRPCISAPYFCVSPSQIPGCQWALCPDGAPKALPPWGKDTPLPRGLKFCLPTAPSPCSEQTPVFDFALLWSVVMLSKPFNHACHSKAFFLRIYEPVYRGCLWSTLCGFYMHLIRC